MTQTGWTFSDLFLFSSCSTRFFSFSFIRCLFEREVPQEFNFLLDLTEKRKTTREQMTVTSNDSDWSFKVLFIGDSSVGKTSLMFRFSGRKFRSNRKKKKRFVVCSRKYFRREFETNDRHRFQNKKNRFQRSESQISILGHGRTRKILQHHSILLRKEIQRCFFSLCSLKFRRTISFSA